MGVIIPLVVAALQWFTFTTRPAADTLTLTVSQHVGMSPFTLRVKAKASQEGREVCVIVDGPEYHQACRELWGVTWTQDFQLRAGGDYITYATTKGYQTREVAIKVIGVGDEP